MRLVRELGREAIWGTRLTHEQGRLVDREVDETGG